jgi:hypothetical protein
MDFTKSHQKQEKRHTNSTLDQYLVLWLDEKHKISSKNGYNTYSIVYQYKWSLFSKSTYFDMGNMWKFILKNKYYTTYMHLSTKTSSSHQENHKLEYMSKPITLSTILTTASTQDFVVSDKTSQSRIHCHIAPAHFYIYCSSKIIHFRSCGILDLKDSSTIYKLSLCLLTQEDCVV